jgi:LPXTG-site transpeptidase (sortase) family protein
MPKFKPKTYIKDESFDPIYKQVNKSFVARSRILPTTLLGLGTLLLVTQVIIPLVWFKTKDEISKPVTSTALGVVSGFGDFEFGELETTRPTQETREGNIPQYFYLSIPRLKIGEALVETNSPSLDPIQALGHYEGSALPGDTGNTFIYGHSVLPWFYNPKNYKTIFSTLGELQTGDSIVVKYNNKQMTYKVESKVVVRAEQVNPLADIKPAYLNESTLSLMTCWPAGTKTKRLLINAVLEK